MGFVCNFWASNLESQPEGSSEVIELIVSHHLSFEVSFQSSDTLSGDGGENGSKQSHHPAQEGYLLNCNLVICQQHCNLQSQQASQA